MPTAPMVRVFANTAVCLALSLSFACGSHAQSVAVEDDFNVALRPWTGDYDGMVKRRMVRIVVPYCMIHYFLDGATERGVAAAMGRELEREINRREGLRSWLVHVVFIPVPRSKLIPYLTAGLGDIAMGNIAITKSRKAKVDFSIPFIRNSQELVVTGPGAPEIRTIEALAGQEVSVQLSGGYYRSLKKLNQSFQ